ncbi:hydrophobic surface binding protein A-domain-containing protein [Aspergillus egyptiacus]|nr:hydrophobic surface binding protein A-domain-containing protein [Aspergillus egyptiacus]
MKFATGLLALTFASSVFAEPIPKEKRALSDYTDVFDGIEAQVGVVSTTVAEYVAGQASSDEVQTEGDELVDTICQGAQDIATFDPLGTLDALALIAPIEALIDTVAALIDDLIAAYSVFEGDGELEAVCANLRAQKECTQSLIDNILPKIPSALQDIAESLATRIITEIDRGIAVFCPA